ncbi:AAA family ATPase, partial [Helicobacter pylori]
MAINIKKIKSFKAFCGLDMIEIDEFKHYNIIFGNNGCGKTSLTRAFE